MKYFYITDAGSVRDHNEDSVTIIENSKGEYITPAIYDRVVL